MRLERSAERDKREISNNYSADYAQSERGAHSKSSRLSLQVKIASGGKKDYTIKNVCGAQAAGAEEMKHETTGLL